MGRAWSASVCAYPSPGLHAWDDAFTQFLAFFHSVGTNSLQALGFADQWLSIAVSRSPEALSVLLWITDDLSINLSLCVCVDARWRALDFTDYLAVSLCLPECNSLRVLELSDYLRLSFIMSACSSVCFVSLSRDPFLCVHICVRVCVRPRIHAPSPSLVVYIRVVSLQRVQNYSIYFEPCNSFAE